MGTTSNLPHIKNTLASSRIHLQQCASSKKKALEVLSSSLASQSDELDQDKIFEALVAREKLGGTALERGVALPHCRIPDCKQPISALITLQQGIDFDARDQQPVSLLWALIVPEDANDTHLTLLADIATLLSDEQRCKQIEQASDPALLYQQLFSD